MIRNNATAIAVVIPAMTAYKTNANYSSLGSLLYGIAYIVFGWSSPKYSPKGPFFVEKSCPAPKTLPSVNCLSPFNEIDTIINLLSI